jgi:integrase/recombinase XerD
MEAYQAALAGAAIAASDVGSSRTKSGTLNAVIVEYYRSKSFTDALAPETQRMRRDILERLRIEHGDKRLALLQRAHVVKLLEPLKPHAQKNYLKTIRALMGFAVVNNMRADNPTDGVKAIKAAKSMGHMTWLEPQIAMYRERYKLGTVARLALELLLNIGPRRYDAHILGHQHIRDGRLCFRPHKTLRTTNKMLKVPIMPEFQKALDAMPNSENVLTFLTTDYGKPFKSAAAFGDKFADWCKEAGLKPVLCDDGRVRSFRAHGLRKASLRALAHAGCTDEEMMSVSGHSDARQLREYLNEVDQERMADSAMAKRMAKTETPTYKPSAARLQTGS